MGYRLRMSAEIYEWLAEACRQEQLRVDTFRARKEVLKAALAAAHTIRDHHREAVLLASEALQEARSGQPPEPPPHEFADAQSFLAGFAR